MECAGVEKDEKIVVLTFCVEHPREQSRDASAHQLVPSPKKPMGIGANADLANSTVCACMTCSVVKGITDRGAEMPA